jgi:polysaccharide deacetylase family protein (PEP-CTERM system associated)
MINVLSVDVEDYFHVEAFASCVKLSEWDKFPVRVDRNVGRVLELFERHRVKATFFVLGWVAKKLPNLVREISKHGHEIACHGFGHQHLRRLTPAQFREDLRAARGHLVDQAQNPVRAYRAPSFSIVKETLWALDVLAEEGFSIDSSIFPAHHDVYGIPDAPRFPYWHKTAQGTSLFEFPPSTVRWSGNNVGVGGGGYLRLLPYAWTRRGIRTINEREKQPAMVYFHPWEIDPEQPRIQASAKSRLRHYTNLAGMENKIERLLRDFQFGTLSDVFKQIEPQRTQRAQRK